MLSISLGPLALPVPPLVLVAAVWLAAWVARRRALAEHAASAESAVWISAGMGLVGARAGWLAEHASAYAAQPLAALDVRDGGWSAWAGILAGAATLAWRARAHRRLHSVLGSAALVGILAWGGLLALVRWVPDDRAAGSQLLTLRLSHLQTGEQKNLQELLAGRAAVVNLWASWCGPCRAEMPMLTAAQRAHPDIVVVLANQGESAATVQRFMQREGLPDDTVWLDASSRLGPAAGSSSLPTTLFLAPDGRLMHTHVGMLNAPALAARLALMRAQSGQR